MDIVTVKQRQQAAWASGDYAAVGARFPIIAELLCEFFATFYGPTVKTLAAVGDRAAALRADMLEAARRFDVSEDGDTLVLRMDYLEAVIHTPAP